MCMSVTGLSRWWATPTNDQRQVQMVGELLTAIQLVKQYAMKNKQKRRLNDTK